MFNQYTVDFHPKIINQLFFFVFIGMNVNTNLSLKDIPLYVNVYHPAIKDVTIYNFVSFWYEKMLTNKAPVITVICNDGNTRVVPGLVAVNCKLFDMHNLLKDPLEKVVITTEMLNKASGCFMQIKNRKVPDKEEPLFEYNPANYNTVIMEVDDDDGDNDISPFLVSICNSEEWDLTMASMFDIRFFETTVCSMGKEKTKQVLKVMNYLMFNGLSVFFKAFVYDLSKFSRIMQEFRLSFEGNEDKCRVANNEERRVIQGYSGTLLETNDWSLSDQRYILKRQLEDCNNYLL